MTPQRKNCNLFMDQHHVQHRHQIQRKLLFVLFLHQGFKQIVLRLNNNFVVPIPFHKTIPIQQAILTMEQSMHTNLQQKIKKHQTTIKSSLCLVQQGTVDQGSRRSRDHVLHHSGEGSGAKQIFSGFVLIYVHLY